MKPHIENWHQGLDQAKGIQIDRRAIFVAPVFLWKCRLEDASPSKSVGEAENMMFGPFGDIFRLSYDLLEIHMRIPTDRKGFEHLLFQNNGLD